MTEGECSDDVFEVFLFAVCSVRNILVFKQCLNDLICLLVGELYLFINRDLSEQHLVLSEGACFI